MTATATRIATIQTNGYDPIWPEVINRALADRGVDVRIEEMTDELWDRFVGPMLDEISRKAVSS